MSDTQNKTAEEIENLINEYAERRTIGDIQKSGFIIGARWANQMSFVYNHKLKLQVEFFKTSATNLSQQKKASDQTIQSLQKENAELNQKAHDHWCDVQELEKELKEAIELLSKLPKYIMVSELSIEVEDFLANK